MLKNWTKKKTIITSVIGLLVVVSAILAIVLSKVLNIGTVSTEYDLVKTTKMNNFTYLNTMAQEKQNVLFGDSITEIYNSSELFADYTKSTGVQVYNRGISSDTSDRLFERLYVNALVIKPRNLVVQIGTNDIAVGIPSDTIIKNITALIEETQQKCPDTNIILESVYPINHEMMVDASAMIGGRSNEAILALNVQLKALANQRHITFLDLTASLTNEKGDFNKAYTYDGLHPNAQGYKIITNQLIEVLK